MQVFNVIYQILFWPCFLYAAYYSLMALVSLIFHRQKYEMQEDKTRFCIFVPCHNEEDVIAATVENYTHIQYDPSLFDIFFLADNCSDKTAERIREAICKAGVSNFYALERNVDDPNKRGKPHALRWGMDLLEEKDEFYSKYDLFITFDADNFVDPDFLKHMNSQYLSYSEKKRPVMIQAYLDSKNKENLVSRGYYVAYRYTNGFFQLAKHKLGLTPGIGGTGFAISLPFLQSIGGYNCRSLVEDVEFETIATLHGKSIAYNHNVRIYDEKPTSFKAATVQKIRWSQGHWWVFFHYAPRLLLHMLNPKEIRYFFKRLDNLIHLSALLFMLLGMFVVISPLVAFCLGTGIPNTIFTVISSVLFISSLLFIPISSLMDGKKEEKRRVLIDFIPNILALAINTISYYYANVVGLFRCGNQKVWVKTKHKVTAITYAMEDGASEETPVLADAASENLISEPSAEEVTLETSEASSPESAVELNV